MNKQTHEYLNRYIRQYIDEKENVPFVILCNTGSKENPEGHIFFTGFDDSDDKVEKLQRISLMNSFLKVNSYYTASDSWDIDNFDSNADMEISTSDNKKSVITVSYFGKSNSTTSFLKYQEIDGENTFDEMIFESKSYIEDIALMRKGNLANLEDPNGGKDKVIEIIKQGGFTNGFTEKEISDLLLVGLENKGVIYEKMDTNLAKALFN